MPSDPANGLPADVVPGLGFDLGPMDQVAFAVADIERTLPTYRALFGPFTVRDVSLGADALILRGRPVAAKLRLASCIRGPMEIELVQVLGGEFPAAEHLARHGEGLHHVRFRVEDVATTCAQMEAAGYGPILHGTAASGSRFAYLESPVLGHTLVEVISPQRTR